MKLSKAGRRLKALIETKFATHRFFGVRGQLDLSRDQSSHRRFAVKHDDLLA